MKALVHVRARGFSLLELLVAVVILGIIAAIALPSYQDYARRARRADAKAVVTDLAQQLERCFTQFGAYDDDNCAVPAEATSPEGYYAVTVESAAATYTVTATAQDIQAADSACSTFSLNHLGQHGATSPDCW